MDRNRIRDEKVSRSLFPPLPPPLEGETMAREHRVVTTQKACIRLDKKCHVNRKLDVMSKGLNSENNVCISSAHGFRG